jgi:hypothetical protein
MPCHRVCLYSPPTSSHLPSSTLAFLPLLPPTKSTLYIPHITKLHLKSIRQIRHILIRLIIEQKPTGDNLHSPILQFVFLAGFE